MTIFEMTKTIISHSAVVCGLVLVELALTSLYAGGQSVFSLVFIVEDFLSPKYKVDIWEVIRFIFYVVLFAFCATTAKWIVSII